MAEQPFIYSGELVAELVDAMSSARFATYLAAAGSETAALQLYTWNTAASAALYGPLQVLEVTLRNAINSRLHVSHGVRWFDDPKVLRASESRIVGEVTQQLYDRGKQPTPGSVVAELSYGFWVALFANAYDTSIWRTDLHAVFRPRVKDRHGLHQTLDRLRTLRNRTAHHEPIFQRNLAEDYKRIRTVVGLLSPPNLRWLDHHSTVDEVLGTQPKDTASF